MIGAETGHVRTLCAWIVRSAARLTGRDEEEDERCKEQELGDDDEEHRGVRVVGTVWCLAGWWRWRWEIGGRTSSTLQFISSPMELRAAGAVPCSVKPHFSDMPFLLCSQRACSTNGKVTRIAALQSTKGGL